MNKLKLTVCFLLVLCLTIGFVSCAKDSTNIETDDNFSTTQAVDDTTSNELTEFLTFNKEYFSHYEWYEDSSTMLVRSEYSDIKLDKSSAEKYPMLAKAIEETSFSRKKTMEEEYQNFIAFATDDFSDDAEAFTTYNSKLDVNVRRADSVAVSILEDYSTESFRSLCGFNYDTESGKLLTLSDVVTDYSEIPSSIEKELINRIGAEEPYGETAVIDYFNNHSQEDIAWTLDYNGVTFWFDAGDIAPTNFGIQAVTVTFAEYPELFNKKYTLVPNEYIVALPISVPFFTDITGENTTEEILVSGECVEDEKFYHTISISSEISEYETDRFSYIEPYYVRTPDGNSYICIFSLINEEEGRNSTLSIYELENGEVRLLGTSKTDLDYKGNNVYAFSTDPNSFITSIKD